jgi:UDP-N-acetylmuramoylalanine--D-glutamate ligase
MEQIPPQKIAILGAGVSGQAACRLADSQGHTTCLFDQNGRGDTDVLTRELLEPFDSIVLSPGFGHAHPWRQIALNSSKPCYGELGFAACHWRGNVIGVTGTNGKSTLTKFLCQALQHSGRQAVAAGNIGYPFSDAVLSEVNRPEAYAIVEVSSFQAELPFGLKLDGLIWSNFAEDHLDRYDSMSDYFAAKANLFSCLVSDSICVMSRQVRDWMDRMNSKLNTFSIVSGDSDLLAQLAPQSPFKHFPQSENFSLVAELWCLLDLPEASLLETANSFELAPHRLKCVATWSGAHFWNDSKATNFHATLAALSVLKKPIFWIGGGQVKGGDVEAFARGVTVDVEAAFVYGEVGQRLAEELRKSLKMVKVYDKFEEAVLAAAEAASGIEGANVLLSPGFSSFDQFPSYEARGKCFNSTVLSLNGVKALQ